jgi:Icc-related predicted phosphoesterase
MSPKQGKSETDTNGTVRVAAVGDVHVNESTAPVFRELLKNVSSHADILVLCGDLTNRGLAREAQVVAEELVTCKLPVVGVLGNHDMESGEQEEVTKILCQAGVSMLEDQPCEIQGVGFAGVVGFCGGFDRNALAPFGEDLIKRFVHETIDQALQLESALARLRTQHKLAVLHYAPIRDTVEGEPPEIFPFLGSSRLEEPVDRYEVSAAVHGHAHGGAPQGKTRSGVPVYNVALPLMRRVNPEQPYLVLTL